jgi:hypothetical protein
MERSYRHYNFITSLYKLNLSGLLVDFMYKLEILASIMKICLLLLCIDLRLFSVIEFLFILYQLFTIQQQHAPTLRKNVSSNFISSCYAWNRFTLFMLNSGVNDIYG